MKRLMTRPRSLLLAVALAIVAALGTVSTANAASSASETVVPAPPSNLTAKAISPTSVHLTWTNNAANQSGVVISRDGVESVDVQGATVSSYTWSGLSPGTKYWFYVASKIYGTPGDPTGSGNTQSAWVGPVYATTPKTTGNPNCGHPVMFGLHGMAEGPSGTIPAISPELESFDTDQNAISGAVLMAPISYTTVNANAWSVLLKTHHAVTTGEENLQSAIKSWTAGCATSQDKIALVGYSMGAWVINLWIMDHPLERFMIKAVVLFGDPCKVNGNDKGLVRRAGGVGFMPAADYPYPIPGGTTANPFPVKSWTMPNDPVTGAGWAGKSFYDQLTAAVNCVKNHCSHLNYTGGTEIYEGALFVVKQLVG